MFVTDTLPIPMANTPEPSTSADQQSRILGGLVVLAAVVAGSLFLAGIFSGDAELRFWALAVPVGGAVLFGLSLIVWIGWTILTVHTEPSGDPLPATGSPGGPTATAAPPAKSDATTAGAPSPKSDESAPRSDSDPG